MEHRAKASETELRQFNPRSDGSLAAYLLLIVYISAAFLVITLSFIPKENAPGFNNWVALIGMCGTVFSVLVAAYSFWSSAENNRSQARKQHTVTILLESRLSTEFRKVNWNRKTIYRPDEDILYYDWRAGYDRILMHPGQTKEKTDERYVAAEALLFLLNYYEFLALGIKTGDLDEELLKGTMRGLMCSLVDDARDVIFHLRVGRPKVYKNLFELHEAWRDPNMRNTRGELSERSITCVCDIHSPQHALALQS